MPYDLPHDHTAVDGCFSGGAAHGFPGSRRKPLRAERVRGPHEHLQQGWGGDRVRRVPPRAGVAAQHWPRTEVGRRGVADRPVRHAAAADRIVTGIARDGGYRVRSVPQANFIAI